MVARNDITGDMLTSGGSNSAYRDNYDAIFGKKAVEPEAKVEMKPAPEQVKMVEVFYLTVDYGDGSNGVRFFRHETSATALLDGDDYYGNEGTVNSFRIPEGPNSINFSD